MTNFLISIYSLLFINSFIKVFPFLGSENQPIVILFSFLLSIAYFLYSNNKYAFFNLSKYNQYFILLPPIVTLLFFGIKNYFASIYSLLVYFQIPIYIYSSIFLFSKLINRKLFINYFFNWLYVILPLSLLLNIQEIYINGLSGERSSFKRGGGLPLYAPEPSALVALSLSLTTLYLLMNELKLKDLYGVKKNRILILILFIFLATKSASIFIYSVGLVIPYFLYKRLSDLQNLKFKIVISKTTKKFFNLTLIFSIFAISFIYINPDILDALLKLRPIYVIRDIFIYGLPKILFHSSYRLAFTLASFRPDSILNIFIGHGLDNWYGNYLDQTYNATYLVGQDTTTFYRLMNENRLMSIRPPTVLGYVFYSYGLLGVFILLNLITSFWKSKNFEFLNIDNKKLIPYLFLFLFIYIMLIPGLAYNPLLFSIFPFSLITIYYSYERKKNSS